MFPLVEKFLPGEKKPPDANPPSKCAKNDRLVQLLIKGVLYESCVAYCQGKATGSQEPRSQVRKLANISSSVLKNRNVYKLKRKKLPFSRR